MTSVDAGISPGTTFTDDRGLVAQLHGVGIQFWEGRYWAWGEDKTAGGVFTAIACYRSDDLEYWRFEGNALERGAGDLGADRVVERPKVLRRPDGRFVMLLHIDSPDYADARLGYAIADAPQGPYRYIGGSRPLGNESRDIGVYQAGDAAYLLSEDRPHGLAIYRLSPDYLSVESRVALLTSPGRACPGWESPTLVRHEGLYYLFGSDLTGWNMNDNVYATATDLAGPWSEWRLLAPAGSHTFESQVSVVLPVESPDGTRFVYIGDRWTPDDLYRSPAVWLPLVLENGSAQLEWRDRWSLNDV